MSVAELTIKRLNDDAFTYTRNLAKVHVAT